jgi:hypothetical protein
VRSTFSAYNTTNVDLATRIRRAATAAVAVLAFSVAAVPAASAEPPARITVVGVFNPITYGDNAYVNGQLLGNEQGGQLVVLEQSNPPAFTDWTPIAETTADPAGYYSFKLKPTQNTQYRTSSQGYGSERAVQVNVAPRVRFSAQAAGASSIRFSGSIAPAFADQSIEIQKHLAGGGWTRVATARLKGGRTYSGRIRARRATDLRAFYPSDDAHPNGISRSVKVTPGAHASTARAAACRAPSITRITTRPDPPVARKAMTLRVTASMPAGQMYAIDVLWGESDKRDHFTLAPSLREQKVTFTLRHRYATPGDYTLRIRVFGRSGECRNSSTRRPHLRAIRAPEQYQR